MRPRRATLLAGSLLALAAIATPASAAGTYTTYLGTLPDGTPTPAGPWVDTGANGGLNHGSRSGGEFGVWMAPGSGLGHTQTAVLPTPANLSVASAWADRFFNAPVSWAVFQPQIETTWENRGSWGGGYGGESGDGPVSISGPSSLSVTVRCANTVGGSDPTPRCTGGGWWVMRRVQLGMSDAITPNGSLDGSGGPLLDASWKTAATVSATLRASDMGSGVYRFFLRERAGTTRYVLADAASATCKDARPGVGGDYEFRATTSSLVPCAVTERTYTPSFDLAAIGDGAHAGMSLGVEDASGRERIVADDLTVRINAPGGALPDPGTPCQNGTHDASGTCIARPPANVGRPVLTGTPTEGGTLSTDDGAWNDVTGAAYRYAWELCDLAGDACTTIADQTDPALTVTAAMVDHTIRSVVTATTDGGATTVRSAPSDPIDRAPGGGQLGGAGGLRDAIVRTVIGGGGGGGGGVQLSADEAASLPVPPVTPTTSRAVNGDGADGSAELEARLTGGDEVLVYGATRPFAGRLTTATGRPIAKAQIDVIVHTAVQGAHGAVAGAVRSDDDGRFTFSPPVGPSRIYTFGYRLHVSDTAYVRWVSVGLPVVGKVSLATDRRIARNGQTVAFRGAVAGAPAGVRRTIDLQVQVGRRWQTIATPRLTNGRFRIAYRFTRTYRRESYRFRALVRGSATWPLRTATSPTRQVTVRPAVGRVSRTAEVER